MMAVLCFQILAVMARKRFATPMARRRKSVMNDISNGKTDDKVEAVLQDKEQLLLECRCYLSSFAKRVRQWKMNDREWALLRKTPFGELIKDILGLDVNMEIVDALLGFWDEEHCGFIAGGIIIPFTVDDIALITGLPNRGQKVMREYVGSKYPEFNRIFLNLKNIERRLNFFFSNRKDPNPETDKNFVQQMILYLWGSVLFPSSSRIVPKYMTKYVKNLDAIGTFNWAEALHSFLVKEINAKAMIVKERNEGKRAVVGYMNGLCFIICAWFFEHVDFGEDSRPFNPEVRPRMLKWVKGCKFWQRIPFLQRFREIMVDKVSYCLLPKKDEFELISLPSMKRMHSQNGCSDDAMWGNASLAENLKVLGPEGRPGYDGNEQQGRELKKKKQETKVENLESSEIWCLIEEISILEMKVVKLGTLVASNGWEIEGIVDKMNGKADKQVSYDLTEMFHKSCIEGENGQSVGVVGHPIFSSIARDKMQACQQHEEKKILKSTIAKERLMLKRRRDITKEQASISSIENLERFKRKGNNVLVNLDDYACPTEQKKEANVVPLNYVGRELLKKNVRKYLDAFCIKPMQKDDIVFFDWNISIRRHSMVEYLQGGYTGEEIIDAYARILSEGIKMTGNNFTSFLYVPPMFLGLYRNKLGSYKTFLNDVDRKSLEKANLLILPCHISSANHWLLLVCDMKMHKWIGFDSLYDPRHREAAKAQIMLLTDYLYQDHALDITSWGFEYRRIYPQQEPGTLDCGVFVMKFIESIIQVPREINFRGTDMQLFRPQIAYQILLHC